MNSDELLIEKFFNAFKKLDAKTMCECYADDVVFYDPMFDLLHGEHAKAMWQMLCKSATDFSLIYNSITNLDDGYYTCKWVATYTFSNTKQKVINDCKAHFKILDGLIIEHSDAWSFYKWSEQAFGLTGKLLGGLGLFRNRIKNSAKMQLLNYIENNKAHNKL